MHFPPTLTPLFRKWEVHFYSSFCLCITLVTHTLPLVICCRRMKSDTLLKDMVDSGQSRKLCECEKSKWTCSIISCLLCWTEYSTFDVYLHVI